MPHAAQPNPYTHGTTMRMLHTSTTKKRTDELKVKMMDQYLKLIQKQKGSRKAVPPGLYAEYGYALYMGGKKEEGLNYLKQEMKLYPESETYISRIIKQLEK